jgi:hypothetical protein
MTEQDFIKMMKERGTEMIKLDKKTQSVVGNTSKQVTNTQNKKSKNKDDDLVDDPDDDEAELQINEEFKDVLKGVRFRINLATKSSS